MPKQCPHCNKMLDMDSCITRSPDNKIIESEPQIGDVTICVECGEFCEFGPRNTLIKIASAEKLENLKNDEDANMAKHMVRCIIASKDMNKRDAYSNQIKQMALRVRIWNKANPTLSPMIQRNSPNTVGVIASLTDAMEHKYISINDDAKIMFTELGWLEERDLMPTVFMVETAIELAFKEGVDLT